MKTRSHAASSTRRSARHFGGSLLVLLVLAVAAAVADGFLVVVKEQQRFPLSSLLLLLSSSSYSRIHPSLSNHYQQNRPTALFLSEQPQLESDSESEAESTMVVDTSDNDYDIDIDIDIDNNASPNAALRKKLDSSFAYTGRMQGDSYQDAAFRCGFVSIIGAPNMGKSTLLNALLQEELCIATARPQTTRHAILGLLNTDQAQVCLVDTPGVIDEPAYKLQEGMMEAVVGAVYDADVLLVVTDLFSTPIPDDALFEKVVKMMRQKPVLVAVNKIDLAKKVNVKLTENQEKTVTVEQAVHRWRQLLPDALAIIPVAASLGPDNPGVVALRALLTGGPDVPAAIRNLGRPVPGMFRPGSAPFLTNAQAAAMLPVSPPLYDSEILTDRPERFMASEMIRAALFQSLKKELPYCCEVQIDSFKEPSSTDEAGNKQKAVIRISAHIYVERDSQKIIVIGKNGQQIKQIGVAAREKLEEFFQAQVSNSVVSVCLLLLFCMVVFL